MNIEAIAGLLKVAGKKAEYDGYDKYSLLSLRGIFSPDYNCLFDMSSGEFARWGATLADDPERCVFGAELLDVELSSGDCSSGAGNGAAGFCRWCYKNNTAHNGKHMSLETFKSILDKVPPTVFQIALGITDADKHPELLEIMRYCREVDIIPNLTTAGFGLPQDLLEKIAGLAGAVAVSVYPHSKELAYKTIRAFQAEGMDQVNIHLLYHADNLPFVYGVLQDVKNKVVTPNAVVLLGLKPKGRGSNMKPLVSEKFTELIRWCMDNELPMGFDSCSASKFLRAVDDLDVSDRQRDYFHTVAEPCESSLFSLYIDVNANVFPCSFTEGVEQPISMLEAEDFVADVWDHPSMQAWRKKLLANDRRCPVYKID